jgi:PKD repeat protein
MRRSILYTLAITLLCSADLFSQSIPKDDKCGTMFQDSISRRRFPERGSLDEFEKFLKIKIEEIDKLRAAGRTQAGVLTIPIIVHVVHNGEALGSGTNLSQAQVKAQIDVLNEDFRRLAGTPGENSDPSGADIEIEFCLSVVDENGNAMAEPGIDRVDGNQPDWKRDDIENKLKPNTYWDPNKFYNIWTVKFAAVDANLIGYAQFPDQSGLPGLQEQGGPAATDGVVIRYQSFGSVNKGTFPVMQAPYNKGRTLTHETGHWLGLRHIWGDGNCADDFVSDTPPQAGPSNGCPLGRVSCGTTNMVQNYMDYSDDACMNIFTKGQKTRMLAVMEVSPRRKTLIQNNLCGTIVAEKPVANFTIEKQLCILLGSQVTFTDLSTNFPDEWAWTFEGGDPSTSNVKNPQVTYNSPGTFDVTLIVKNEKGGDTLTIADFITVTEEGLCTSFNNFEPGYTPSILPLNSFVPTASGYLTGTNSINNNAFSEYFSNNCGYKYISGVSIKFGVFSTPSDDSKVTFVVWNARGKQNSPGAVLERKEVVAKQIQDDIANDRATTVTFDRETPLFSKPFHVGVEIDNGENYSFAITSSANGEATKATSWVRHSNGEWELFTIAYGANIAMDIAPDVGINPSVQVSASKLLISPGEEVQLNGRGASIFIWNSSDGTITDVAGPQIIVTPTSTTTYTTSGSGLPLCNDETVTTIYVRENVVESEGPLSLEKLSVYPNPSLEDIEISFENSFRGTVGVDIISMTGQSALKRMTALKGNQRFKQKVVTSEIPAGFYLIRIKTDKAVSLIKWVKQ